MQLNCITKELKNMLAKVKNREVQQYLKNLAMTTDYSLWRATKKLKQPNLYPHPYINLIAGQGMILKAVPLANVFTPNLSINPFDDSISRTISGDTAIC